MNMLEKIVKSHLLQHTHQSGYTVVSIDNFRIVKRGFKNQRMKRKTSETLLIKKYRPSLNKQENSVPLCYLINHRRIHIPVKYLWWGFLVKVFYSFNTADCFCRRLTLGFLNGFWFTLFANILITFILFKLYNNWFYWNVGSCNKVFFKFLICK